MANEKISQLTPHTANASDVIPVEVGGVNYSDTVSGIVSLAQASAASTYLPLNGGDLSGGLTAPSGNFNGNLLGIINRPPVFSTIVNDGNYDAFPGLSHMVNGNLIVVYRAATAHAGVKGTIMSRTSSDGGNTWSIASMAYVDATYDSRDPSITLMANGSLILSFFTEDINTLAGISAYTITSSDGVTWGTPVSVGSFSSSSNVSSPVIQLSNGNLLLATYGVDSGNQITKVSISTNNGGSWSVLSTLDSVANCSEPNLLLLANGNILATVRDGVSTGITAVYTSINSGATWLSTSSFPTGSRAGLVQGANGIVMSSYRSVNPGLFDALVINYSTNNGVTWSEDALVEGMNGAGFADRLPSEYAAWVTSVSPTDPSPGLAYSLQESTSVASIFFRTFNSIPVPADAVTASSILTYGNLTTPTFSSLNILIEGSSPYTTAVGYSSLASSNFNTGVYNTAFGLYALQHNTTGSYNVSLGYSSGVTSTPGNANVSGSYNVWIGSGAGSANSNQLNNSVAIGNSALNTASNQIMLGNNSVSSVVVPTTASAATFIASVLAGSNVIGGGSGVPSAPVNTTGATLLVVATTSSVSATVMSDSAGNSWSYGTTYGSGVPLTRIAYVLNPITSSTHTFTATATNTTAIVYAFSGSFIGLSAQNGLAVSGSGTFQPGSVTPTEAGDLIITGVGSNGITSTSIIDSGFSAPINQLADGGEVNSASYLISPAGAAVNPTWTMQHNTDWSAVISVFRVASGIILSASGSINSMDTGAPGFIFGTKSITANQPLSSPTLIETSTLTPASATTAGVTGQIAWQGTNGTTGQVFICTSGGTAGNAIWMAALLTKV